MTVGQTYAAGPGTIHFGDVGGPIDASCMVNTLVIEPTKDQGESETKLCGDVVVPKATYAYTMKGNIDHDLTDPDGLWALSQVAPGSLVPFTYVPSTEAGTEAAGFVYIDPMKFGYEGDYGEIMASDIEWLLNGPPTYTMGGVPLVPVTP